MKTCACCGQTIRPEASRPTRTEAAGRTTVQVDDDLLRLCNLAYGEAELRSSQQVEIAHLAWCLTRAADSERWFVIEDVSRAALAHAADQWLAQAERSRGGRAMQTSDELKELLARTERIANRDERHYASPQDFLRALAQQAEGLTSAAFAASALGSARRRSPPRAEDEIGTTRAPRELLPPQPPLGRPAKPDARIDARINAGWLDRRDAHDDPAGAVELRQRLDRQERQIVELSAVITRLIERLDDRAGHTAPGRADASGGYPTDGRQSDRRKDKARPPFRSWRSRLRRRVVAVGRSRGVDEAASCRPRESMARDAGNLRRSLPRVEAVEPHRQLRAVRELGVELDAGIHATADNDTEDDAEGLGDRLKRFYLSPDDDIVKAPSIGPRTAARLKPVGLVLVRDLLACDPEEIVTRTAIRYITAGRIAEWKAQARLVCTIPWLRGTHAQLLVGAGYDTLAKLARADASAVCGAILRFAATREGQSILRSGPPPEIDRIACWIENTALAEPARAA